MKMKPVIILHAYNLNLVLNLFQIVNYIQIVFLLNVTLR